MPAAAKRRTTINNRRIGARVKEARLALGFQQATLARVLNMGTPAINKKEDGSNVITAEQLAKLATLLERPADWFLQDVR